MVISLGALLQEFKRLVQANCFQIHLRQQLFQHHRLELGGLVHWQLHHIVFDYENVVVEVEKPVDCAHHDTRKGQTRLHSMSLSQLESNNMFITHNDHRLDTLRFQNLLQSITGSQSPPRLGKNNVLLIHLEAAINLDLGRASLKSTEWSDEVGKRLILFDLWLSMSEGERGEDGQRARSLLMHSLVPANVICDQSLAFCGIFDGTHQNGHPV